MKVSVVIPTYSRANFVCEAIDSVLAQQVDDVEVVVIDDGSKDDTADRLRDYGDSIVFETQENQGLSAARNRGIEISTGDYIALLDDDDWWMPGKLAMQCELLDRLPELAGVYTNFTIYRSDDDVTPGGIRTWYDSPVDWSTVFASSSTLHSVLGDSSAPVPDAAIYFGSVYALSLEKYYVLPSTALVRRSCLPPEPWFPLHDPICGDWDFFARISKDSPLCFVDADTVYNRSHKDEHRLTQTRMLEQMRLRVDFLERVYRADEDFYRQHQDKVDRVWVERLSQLCKLQLLEGDKNGARESARKARRIGRPGRLSGRAILGLAGVPGASSVLRLARGLKRRL